MLFHVSAPRICIIGDSHLSGIKKAHDAGQINWPDGARVEFWGAAGPLFRDICWAKGAMQAGKKAGPSVTRINAAGRGHISPKDFDLIIFFGARMRIFEYFGEVLCWRARSGTWGSRALQDAMAAAYLETIRVYRAATEFAARGVQAMCFPVPFPTADVVAHDGQKGIFDAYPHARDATAEDRTRIWSRLRDIASGAGVDLIAQPDHTVVQGLLTASDYACDGAWETNDIVHKNADFAALWVNDALETLRRQGSDTYELIREVRGQGGNVPGPNGFTPRQDDSAVADARQLRQ